MKIGIVCPEPEVVGNDFPFAHRFADVRLLFVRKIIVISVSEQRELNYEIFVRNDGFVKRDELSVFGLYGRVFCVVVSKSHDFYPSRAFFRKVFIEFAHYNVAKSYQNSAAFIFCFERAVVFVVEIIGSVFLRETENLDVRVFFDILFHFVDDDLRNAYVHAFVELAVVRNSVRDIYRRQNFGVYVNKTVKLGVVVAVFFKRNVKMKVVIYVSAVNRRLSAVRFIHFGK